MPEVRVLSECTSSSGLSRTLRGLCTLGMHVRFEDILRATRVAYPKNALSLGCSPAYSQDRVLSECTLTLRLPRVLRGLCPVGVRVWFDAIARAPRVARPRNAPSL